MGPGKTLIHVRVRIIHGYGTVGGCDLEEFVTKSWLPQQN